jgi:hypothetical protein
VIDTDALHARMQRVVCCDRGEPSRVGGRMVRCAKVEGGRPRRGCQGAGVIEVDVKRGWSYEVKFPFSLPTRQPRLHCAAVCSPHSPESQSDNCLFTAPLDDSFARPFALYPHPNPEQAASSPLPTSLNNSSARPFAFCHQAVGISPLPLQKARPHYVCGLTVGKLLFCRCLLFRCSEKAVRLSNSASAPTSTPFLAPYSVRHPHHLHRTHLDRLL